MSIDTSDLEGVQQEKSWKVQNDLQGSRSDLFQQVEYNVAENMQNEENEVLNEDNILIEFIPGAKEKNVIGKIQVFPPLNFENGNAEEEDERSFIIELPTSSNENDYHTDEETFHFFTHEEEPILKPEFKKRATKAVKAILFQPSPSFEQSSCNNNQQNTSMNCYQRQSCSISSKCWQACKQSHIELPPIMSKEINQASNQGFKMMKKLLFPGLPKVITDVWVLMELGLTITQFILAVASISLSTDSERAFNITYIILSIIGLLLALIDSFLHFVQLGSCAQCYEYYKKRSTQTKVSEKIGHTVQCCPKILSMKFKETLGDWFEIIRNVVSELIIYPLIILDLFDLIIGGSYLRRDSSERINFSLFVIGSIFLFISVYLIRGFLLINIAINLRQVPVNTQNSKVGAVGTVFQFCTNGITQLVVHFTIVVTIGAKIHQESPQPCESDCNIASPFLIYACIAGGLIPLCGIAMFFVINYYQLREYSTGFFINMVSLLQSENFAELVFQGEGMNTAKNKALSVANEIHLKTVKKQFKDVQSASYRTKVLYVFKQPILIMVGVTYELLIISFLVSLHFTSDEINGVKFTLFDENFSSVYFITIIIILIANYKTLTLFTIWLTFALMFIILVTVLLPFAVIVYLSIIYLFYLPMVGLAGYVLIIKQVCGLGNRQQKEQGYISKYNMDSVAKENSV